MVAGEEVAEMVAGVVGVEADLLVGEEVEEMGDEEGGVGEGVVGDEGEGEVAVTGKFNH